MMVEKYKIVCVGCNAQLGLAESSRVEMPKECKECGGKRIGMSPYEPKEYVDLVFDLVIFNKVSGESKNCGFLVNKKTLKESAHDLNKMREVLALEMAGAVRKIISNDQLLVELLDGAKK